MFPLLCSVAGLLQVKIWENRELAALRHPVLWAFNLRRTDAPEQRVGNHSVEPSLGGGYEVNIISLCLG